MLFFFATRSSYSTSGLHQKCHKNYQKPCKQIEEQGTQVIIQRMDTREFRGDEVQRLQWAIYMHPGSRLIPIARAKKCNLQKKIRSQRSKEMLIVAKHCHANHPHLLPSHGMYEYRSLYLTRNKQEKKKKTKQVRNNHLSLNKSPTYQTIIKHTERYM